MAEYKLSGQNPRYIVNLRQVFDKAYGDKPLPVQRALRQLLNDNAVQQAYAASTVRRIVERTRDQNLDRFDTPLKGPYSKGYQKSLRFEIYGKSAGDINMTLTGAMLASIESRNSGTEITFSFADGNNASKAHGHITGHEGDWRVKRDFFGLPEDEEIKILKDLLNDQFQFAGLETLLATAGAGVSLDLATGAQSTQIDFDNFGEDF